MAKLTLKNTKKQLGIGTFVEKTIKFRGADGQEFEGEIFIKIVPHDDIAHATDIWGIEKSKLTMDHLRKAMLFQLVYEDDKSKFFPKITDTGTVSTEVIDAMYCAADEVLDFTGKNWISAQTVSSGVSLSSTELAEKQ